MSKAWKEKSRSAADKEGVPHSERVPQHSPLAFLQPPTRSTQGFRRNSTHGTTTHYLQPDSKVSNPICIQGTISEHGHLARSQAQKTRTFWPLPSVHVSSRPDGARCPIGEFWGARDVTGHHAIKGGRRTSHTLPCLLSDHHDRGNMNPC